MRARMMVLIAAIAACGAIAVAARSALAEDFVFTVPVVLNSLVPSVNGIEITCTADSDAFYSKHVGIGTIDVPINTATGSFTGNVVVKFNAVPGLDPGTAHYYRCKLWLKDSGTLTQLPCSNPACQTKPGTAFVFEVKGTL